MSVVWVSKKNQIYLNIYVNIQVMVVERSRGCRYQGVVPGYLLCRKRSTYPLVTFTCDPLGVGVYVNSFIASRTMGRTENYRVMYLQLSPSNEAAQGTVRVNGEHGL